MEHSVYQSAFDSLYIDFVIGVAVSLDVIALTFCSAHIYQSGYKTWLRWAKYNAGWHAGLLLFYLVAIDVFSVFAQFLGVVLALPLPDWLASLAPIWSWIGDRFRTHVIIYAAVIAMAYVWWKYSEKVVAVPTSPNIDEAPFFLKPIFRRFKAPSSSTESRWFWHLSACLVAIDMLALAAVVKSGEKLIQFPQGLSNFESSYSLLFEKIVTSANIDFLKATLTVTFAVFSVVFVLCFLSGYISNRFWNSVSSNGEDPLTSLQATLIVISLRLLEPLVIFYFIIHSLAFLVTGIPIHSPAFMLGSGLLVAALVNFVGLKAIIQSAAAQSQSRRDSLQLGEGN